MMYQLTAAGGHAALTHAQTIPLTADAWDITFEGDVLWVLSPVEGATLTAYHVDTREAGDGIQVCARAARLIINGRLFFKLSL